MDTSTIIACVASLAAIALPLMFQEGIKEAIKKSFSDLNPQQVRRTFVVLFIVCFLLVSGTGFGILAATAQEEEPDVPEVSAETDQTQSDVEAIVDLAKTGIETGEEWVDNKRARDSITLANREKRWVYRIGNSKDNESDAWDAAMEVTPLRDIYIFKEERKSYAIICDPVFDKETLEDSLASYRTRLDSLGLNYRIEIVDLMNYCSKKENIVETNAIDKRKNDETFPCLTCDK